MAKQAQTKLSFPKTASSCQAPSQDPIGLTGVQLIAAVSIACSAIDCRHVTGRKGLIIGCSGWLNTADSA